MKLTLQDSRLLKDSISIISELVNEVTFTVDKTKIELVAMDPANVAMVIFKMLSTCFVDYNVEDPKQISVNLEQFKQILRRSKATDTMTLELDEEKNKLNLIFRGDTVRSFSLSLLDNPEAPSRVPNLEFGVEIETNTMLFTEAIEDMDIIADSLSLIVDGNDKFIIQAEGNLSSGKVEITTDHETDIINHKGTNIKSNYSIEYLKKIIKGGKLSTTSKIYFGDNYPLKIEYKILDKLSITSILAPRSPQD